MELMELFKAALIGIVQGITEWLPVSSTGHMILFNEFIKMNVSETFMSTFLVVIQFGSILAVLTIFFKKLNPFDSSKTKIQKNETILVRVWFFRKTEKPDDFPSFLCAEMRKVSKRRSDSGPAATHN